MTNIIPDILSGGAGTRLWLAVRSKYPKYLLTTADYQSMLQATALRMRGLAGLTD